MNRTALVRKANIPALLLTLLLALPSAVSPSVQYRIEDLGDLGGGFARARSANTDGVIVGESLIDAPGQVERAFIWIDGNMRDLGTLGGSRSRALAVNQHGTAVGWAQDSAGVSWAACWDSAGAHALPGLGGSGGSAWAVNSAGNIVGSAYASPGVYHAALWNTDSITDLGTLGGVYSVAYGINSNGGIAGAADNGSGQQRACIWTETGPMDIGALSGGKWDTARSINDSGAVILWGIPYAETAKRAAFWSGMAGDPVVDLGTFGGKESWAYGLNNHGSVVGWASLASGIYHAYVYQGGVMTDLGTLGGQFSSANGVSDDGVIVGWAHDTLGRTHAVRWVPVPEPSGVITMFASLALLTCVAVAAHAGARRRSSRSCRLIRP